MNALRRVLGMASPSDLVRLQQGGASQAVADDFFEVSGGGVTVNGNTTLAAIVLVASAVVSVSAAGATTLPAIGRSAQASVAVSAAGAATLPVPSRSASASAAVLAVGSSTLPAVVLSATASVEQEGVTVNGNTTLPALAVSSVASVGVSGSGAATLPALTLTASASIDTSAVGAAELPAPSLAAVALTFSGSMPEAQTIPVPAGYRLVPASMPPRVEASPVVGRVIPSILARVLPPPPDRPAAETLPVMTKGLERKGFCVSWQAIGNDPIAASTFVAEVGASVFADLFSGCNACVWLDGDTPGTYRVTNTITTASGLAGTRAFLLQVEA